MTTKTGPRYRVYADLVSGGRLVPGQSERCPGPDSYGICPFVGMQTELPCTGATWHYDGAQSWDFEFFPSDSSGICPVAVLDPLGPLPTPGD